MPFFCSIKNSWEIGGKNKCPQIQTIIGGKQATTVCSASKDPITVHILGKGLRIFKWFVRVFQCL